MSAASRPKRLTGLYPGTFDPVTLGHIDIINRAVKLVDHLVIGVATNPSKAPLFTLEERVEMVRAEAEKLAAGHATIQVTAFNSLLVQFAAQMGASVIIRGLRAVSDFEYEFQMVAMNQRLNTEIETVFLMADPRHQAIASRLVKEIAFLGGDVSPFTTPAIAAALVKRCKENNNG
ncbi:MAG TPA: pantetheine-phosphate adenylyltransferase [Rhizomicrobium sp.]|jgi:pantetheine-phosphate adenylyltransferase|nr:pantetheine-phosphate adenylyltransferase [Rhizomicrobium sp.]